MNCNEQSHDNTNSWFQYLIFRSLLTNENINWNRKPESHEILKLVCLNKDANQYHETTKLDCTLCAGIYGGTLLEVQSSRGGKGQSPSRHFLKVVLNDLFFIG